MWADVRIKRQQLRWRNNKTRSTLLEDMPVDWSQCPTVESVPERLGGAWVFKQTRMAVSIVFENLQAGATIEEISQWFDIPLDQIREILDFVARTLQAPDAAGCVKPEWPDFASRMRSIWGRHEPAGKPPSQIIIDEKNERP
jgi:uncharacterized protein (DUF433 family)